MPTYSDAYERDASAPTYPTVTPSEFLTGQYEVMTHPNLSLDSMELLELLTLVEDEFGIEMDEELFAECTTLGEMEDLVLEQIRD